VGISFVTNQTIHQTAHRRYYWKRRQGKDTNHHNRRGGIRTKGLHGLTTAAFFLGYISECTWGGRGRCYLTRYTPVSLQLAADWRWLLMGV